jgi:hypothetical protein
MNEPRQATFNPIIWSARDRWAFRGVGAVLGLIWGALGIAAGVTVGVAIKALLVPGPFGADLLEFPTIIGVCLGMMLGTGQVAGFWLAWRSKRLAGVWLLEVLICGLACIVLGILWGSVIVFVTLAALMAVAGLQFPIIALPYIPFFGALLSAYSVLPAAIVMAPVTVFVWQQTLQRLRSP